MTPPLRHALVRCCLVPLVFMSAVVAQEGVYDWSNSKELASGIRYVRVEAAKPRPLVVHAARMDSSVPGLRLHTTPRRAEWVVGKTETDRQTTRDFLRQSRAQGLNTLVAVNADAFSPWPVPYNQSTPTDLAGLAVSNGVVVSRGSGSPSLIQSRSGRLTIETTTPRTDTEDIAVAVSGFALCLDHGQPLPSGEDLHPRTGLGLSEDSRYLLLVAIDGRQAASRGATTHELGQWLKHFGAHRGINMDGGGSTTLAWWDSSLDGPDKCQILNRPVGNGIRAEQTPADQFIPTERANGNNLGVALDSPSANNDVMH